MGKVMRWSAVGVLAALMLLGGWTAQPADAGPNKGAQFWAYVSPQNNTKQNVTQWTVQIHQRNGSWSGQITSADPYKKLQTPGLSGIFNVVVIASGPKFGQKQLSVQTGSRPDIGSNSNCQAMVGIVSNPDGTDAQYWTVWDAMCD